MNRLDRGPTEVRRGEIATPSVADSMRRLTQAVSRLVREHLQLARAELEKDLKKAGRNAALIASSIPALFAGYLLLMIAVAFGIASRLSLGWSFAIVGAVNLLGGAGLAFQGVRRLTRGADKPDLDHTANELKEDAQWLKELRRH